MDSQIKEFALQLDDVQTKLKRHWKNSPATEDESGKYIQNYLKTPEYLNWRKELLKLNKEENVAKNKIAYLLQQFCPGSLVWEYHTLIYRAKQDEIRTD